MLDLSHLVTESVNPRSLYLDKMEISEITALINDEDKKIAIAVSQQLPIINRAIESIVSCLQKGGRLFLCGAGTSGRLSVMEASECPPTFSTSPELVQGVMAGAPQAFFQAVEGAEDIEENGEKDAQKRSLNNLDFALGVSASGRTPYVLGFLKYAKKLNCPTALLYSGSSNSNTKQPDFIDFIIAPETGPEVLTGSTRMKAATAAKMVLNMITTTTMVMMGKVYENRMVDVNPNSEKLVDRAARIVTHITGCQREIAIQLVRESGNAKIAVVMYAKKIDKITAKKLLEQHQGKLRKILES